MQTPIVPEDPHVPEQGRPGWAPASAWVALVAGFGATLAGSIAVFAVAAIAGVDVDPDDTPPGVLIATLLVQAMAFIGSALLFARAWAAPRPEHFGLRRVRLRTGMGWAVLTWLAFLAFTAAWVTALGSDEEDDLAEDLGADDSAVAAVAFLLAVALVAPIAEETFFRGFFFAALRNWRGPWLGAIVTGLVFGAAHALGSPAVFLLPLAMLGFLLCLLYERTGSLLPCVGVHAFNNGFAAAAALDWSGGASLALAVGAPIVCVGLLLPISRGP